MLTVSKVLKHKKAPHWLCPNGRLALKSTDQRAVEKWFILIVASGVTLGEPLARQSNTAHDDQDEAQANHAPAVASPSVMVLV